MGVVPVTVGAVSVGTTVTDKGALAVLAEPQPKTVCTVMLPEPAPAAAVTVILFVPLPVVIVPTAAGTVHVYELAPVTAATVYTFPVELAQIVAVPVGVGGATGVVLLIVIAKGVVPAVVPHELIAETVILPAVQAIRAVITFVVAPVSIVQPVGRVHE